MPSLNVRVDADRAMARLERVAPAAREALLDSLRDLASAIGDDARARAQAHIRFIGQPKAGTKFPPGSYVDSIHNSAVEKDKKIVGYVRSGHPLAHLMELGYNITDWLIVPGTGKNTTSQAGAIMKFSGSAGDVFRAVVHRHATAVKPYPAMIAAFEAARDDIEDVLKSAVSEKVGEQ